MQWNKTEVLSLGTNLLWCHYRDKYSAKKEDVSSENYINKSLFGFTFPVWLKTVSSASGFCDDSQQGIGPVSAPHRPLLATMCICSSAVVCHAFHSYIEIKCQAAIRRGEWSGTRQHLHEECCLSGNYSTYNFTFCILCLYSVSETKETH
jgi:hypothetical protein